MDIPINTQVEIQSLLWGIKSWNQKGPFHGDWATRAESLVHGLKHYLEGGATVEWFAFVSFLYLRHQVIPSATSGYLEVSPPAKRWAPDEASWPQTFQLLELLAEWACVIYEGSNSWCLVVATENWLRQTYWAPIVCEQYGNVSSCWVLFSNLRREAWVEEKY